MLRERTGKNSQNLFDNVTRFLNRVLLYYVTIAWSFTVVHQQLGTIDAFKTDSCLPLRGHSSYGQVYQGFFMQLPRTAGGP